MGIRFTIDTEVRLVSYILEGITTLDHARAFLGAVLTHPDYEPGFNFLGDRREITEDPDSAYIRAVSFEVLAKCAVLAPCRWAVLVSSDAGYGMARMWGILTQGSGVEIRPFRTEREAIAWLGLPLFFSPRPPQGMCLADTS